MLEDEHSQSFTTELKHNLIIHRLFYKVNMVISYSIDYYSLLSFL